MVKFKQLTTISTKKNQMKLYEVYLYSLYTLFKILKLSQFD